MNDYKFMLLIFLDAAILIGLLGYYIYFSSLNPKGEDGGIKKPLKKRFFFFIMLTAVLLILLTITIPKSPYFLFTDKSPSKVVFVDTRQFNFIMSYQAIDPKNNSSGEAIELPVDKPVEFRVTSLDVNHGFGIYDQHSHLITQTQAMPGYVNRLRWKFTEPGTYKVLCLEYCGLGHPAMSSSFIVK